MLILFPLGNGYSFLMALLTITRIRSCNGGNRKHLVMLETRLHRIHWKLINFCCSSSIFLSSSSVSWTCSGSFVGYFFDSMFLDVLSSFTMLSSIFLCPPLNYLTGRVNRTTSCLRSTSHLAIILLDYRGGTAIPFQDRSWLIAYRSHSIGANS